MAIATMRQLLEAGIHFGHQTRRWHPKMARYIYGQRNGIYIIDLKQTLRQLYRAYGMVRDTVANGGNVLFVGTKKQAQEVVEREAQRAGMYYVTNRWLGGMLTNFQTVRKSIQDLQELRELERSGTIERFTKKERVMFRKRRERLERNLSGIQDMPRLPDLVFVASAKNEGIAVHEAGRLGIPCIGIVDTNCDPDNVSLPVPGNDDAIRALTLFCSVIADAALEGRMQFEKVQAAEAEKTAGRDKGAEEGADKPEPEPEAAAKPADEPQTQTTEQIAEEGGEPQVAPSEAARSIPREDAVDHQEDLPPGAEGAEAEQTRV